MTPDPVQGLDVLPEYTDQPAIPDHLTLIWNALINRAVPRYASDAQRDVGIPSPVDGQLCWVDDGVTEALQLRASGGWRQIWPLDGAYGTEWKAYSPSLGGGWNVGTGGSVTGYSQQVGKLVHFRVEIVFGTGTLAIGTTIGLPGNRRGGSAPPAAELGRWYGSSGTITGGRSGPAYISGAASGFRLAQADGTGVSGTVPWTWAAGYTLTVTGSYEAA